MISAGRGFSRSNGPPGTAWANAKVTIEMKNITGIIHRTRRTT